MKKKFRILKNLLLFNIAFMLFSCEVQEDFVEYKSEMKIKKVSVKDIMQKPEHKNVRKPISDFKEIALSKNKQNTQAKLVYNEQYGLYIDDENGMFIEKDGSQSYTFRIRRTGTEDKLENIVFKSNSNGDFETLIVTYDITYDEIKNLGKEEIQNRNVQYSTYNYQTEDLPTLVCVQTWEFTVVPPDEGDLTGGSIDYVGIWVLSAEDCAWVGGGGGGSTSGVGGTSGNTGGYTGGGGGGGSNNTGGTNTNTPIITTPMYPDGTSAAPDFLINAFGGESQLTAEQLNWIENTANDNSVNLILNFLSQNGNNQQSILFALELINLKPKDSNAIGFLLQAKLQDKMTSELDNAFLQSVNQYLAIDTSTIDPIVMAQLRTYFTVKCAVLRHNHPDWSDLRIYYKASVGIANIVLDVFGMVPVVGEIADLTNGVLYLIEGDGVNATLSFAATVPIAGWTATGTKYAIKIVDAMQTATTIATKVKLTWKVVNGVIDFGNRSDLRKVLGLLPGNPNQAHHLIPWDVRTHPAVQKAAKSGSAFHMNEALNGIPRPSNLHLTGHSTYNTKIQQTLNTLDPNASVDEAYDFVSGLTNHIRTLINNNPTLNSGQIANLISYP